MTDNLHMKALVLFFFVSLNLLASDPGVKGKISRTKGCSDKVMVWLSLDKEDYSKRLLLMHTLVPVGGMYQFYLKPGRYQVRASDKLGCEFQKRIEVKDGPLDIPVMMVKK